MRSVAEKSSGLGGRGDTDGYHVGERLCSSKAFPSYSLSQCTSPMSNSSSSRRRAMCRLTCAKNLDRRLLYLFQERKVSELEAPGCRLYMIYDTQSTTNAYHRARPSREINKESKKTATTSSTNVKVPILSCIWAAQERIWGGGETQSITTSVFKTSCITKRILQ